MWTLVCKTGEVRKGFVLWVWLWLGRQLCLPMREVGGTRVSMPCMYEAKQATKGWQQQDRSSVVRGVRTKGGRGGESCSDGLGKIALQRLT